MTPIRACLVMLVGCGFLGCSSTARLFVDVRTDIDPAEFVRIRTEVLPGENGTRVVEAAEISSPGSPVCAEGLRVGEFTSLAQGTYEIRASLLGASGNSLAEVHRTVRLQSSFGMTLEIPKDGVRLACALPPDGGGPDATIDAPISDATPDTDPPVDAADDAAGDAIVDSPPDVSTDSSTDAAADTGPDATGTIAPGFPCSLDGDCESGICWDIADYEPLCSGGTVCSAPCVGDAVCQSYAATAGESDPSTIHCGDDMICDFRNSHSVLYTCS